MLGFHRNPGRYPEIRGYTEKTKIIMQNEGPAARLPASMINAHRIILKMTGMVGAPVSHPIISISNS